MPKNKEDKKVYDISEVRMFLNIPGEEPREIIPPTEDDLAFWVHKPKVKEDA